MGILGDNLKNMANETKESNFTSYLKKTAAPFYKMELDTNLMLDVIPFKVTSNTYHDYHPSLYKFVKASPNYSFTRAFAIHNNVGADERSVVCPQSIGERCPICEEMRVYTENFKNRDKMDEWKNKLRRTTSYRQLLNFYDLNKGDGVMYVWNVSVSYFLKKILDEVKCNSAYANFAELENGMTLLAKIRAGTMKNKKGEPVPSVSDISFLPRNKAYTQADVEKAYNLDDMLDVLSYKNLHSLFFNGFIENEEKKEAPVAPPPTAPAAQAPIAKAPTTEPQAGTCPHGNQFGVDFMQKENCRVCPQEIWNVCCKNHK